MPDWRHMRCGSIFAGQAPPLNCPMCSAATFETGWAHLGPSEPGRANRTSKRGRRARKSRCADNRRAYVYKRDGYRCVECGTQENLTLDHIVPVSKGGRNTRANLQTMCSNCNNAKGAKMPEAAVA